MGRSKLRKKKKTPQGSSINLVKTLEETIAHYKAGRLVECLQGCRKILTVDKHNPNIFKLAGDLEAKVGDPIQAEDYLNAAVKFAPRDADAHYLLAGAQMTNGRIENAIKSYNSALQIRPDYIEAYNNLAIAEMSMGDYESAQGSLQSLIGLKPDHATAHYNLGSIFMRQDRIIDAIQSVRQAIRYAPDEQNYWGYLIHLYNMLPDIELDDEMKGDVASIITSHDLSLAPITALACKFILNDPEVRKLIAKATASIDTFAIEEWLSDETLNALSQPIIQSYVARARLIEVGFERVLTNVRRAILLSSNGPPINIDLLSAIADQCFYNEYVFLISDEEANALIRLEQHMTSTLADGDKLQPEEIAIYASYKALFKLPGFSKNVAKDHALLHPDVSGLIQHQILEPLSEREIIIEIPSISEISDQVSQKVRAQYEENPFPRWRNFEKSVVVSLKHYLKNMFNVGEEGDEFPSSPRILVAGCGTGRHPIAVAQTIEKCHVLAVDLSQASIAYGWRKAREYEVKNIEFKHGDILSLGELQTEFDMIECSGVLHHMENPEAGWKVLTGLLSPSGYMKVGLYSELARQNVVVAARSFIAERGIPSTIEGIREFRKLVFEMPDDHPVKSVVSYLDFFTASDCRDLLFHVQEHRFTISRIRTALANLNLEFCGFHFAGQNTEIAAYKEAYPDDPSCLSLDNWEAFEDKNPNTFAAMYNFFVRKAPAN